MTNNSVHNQTMLHVEDSIIIDPVVNVTLMIEDNNSKNTTLLSTLSSMDVVFPDRKISTANYKQFNTATQNNAHRTEIANNTILDG